MGMAENCGEAETNFWMFRRVGAISKATEGRPWFKGHEARKMDSTVSFEH